MSTQAGGQSRAGPVARMLGGAACQSLVSAGVAAAQEWNAGHTSASRLQEYCSSTTRMSPMPRSGALEHLAPRQLAKVG